MSRNGAASLRGALVRSSRTHGSAFAFGAENMYDSVLGGARPRAQGVRGLLGTPRILCAGRGWLAGPPWGGRKKANCMLRGMYLSFAKLLVSCIEVFFDHRVLQSLSLPAPPDGRPASPAGIVSAVHPINPTAEAAATCQSIIRSPRVHGPSYRKGYASTIGEHICLCDIHLKRDLLPRSTGGL